MIEYISFIVTLHFDVKFLFTGAVHTDFIHNVLF